MTTVNESARRREYVIAGSAVLAYDFAILDDDDIEVIQDGTTLVKPQYQVTGVGNSEGGTVILATAPTDGTHVVVLGKQPRKQVSEYTLEAFPPSRIQNDFNKIWMSIQQAYEVLNRAPAFAKSSLIDAPAIPDPAAVDTFLAIASLSPLAFSWKTLAVLANAVGIPLSFGNGGTNAAYANENALAQGLKLAQWASMTITPGSNVLILPNPLQGNRVLVNAGNFSSITTSGVAIGTVIVLDYVVGGNVLTDTANMQLQARSGFTTVAGSRSLFFFDGLAWYEIWRFPALDIANAGKFYRGDGTLQALALQFNPAGIVRGLQLSNGSDAANDINIASGDAFTDDIDPTLRQSMRTSVAFTKQVDATWAAGSNAGGRIASQALGDGTWHIFMFVRGNGVIDYCFSNTLSFTFPDGGTRGLRIGSVIRFGGSFILFKHYGRTFIYLTAVNLWAAVVPTANRQLVNAFVPCNVACRAVLNVHDTGTAGHVLFTNPDESDFAPSVSAAPYASIGTAGGANTGQVIVTTSRASVQQQGQFGIRSTASKTINIAIIEFQDLDLLTVQG